MKGDPLDLRNLPIEEQVDRELADDQYLPSRHGTPAAYNKGCKGPLCRKAQRDRVKKARGSTTRNMMDDYLEARLAEHYEIKKDAVA